MCVISMRRRRQVTKEVIDCHYAFVQVLALLDSEGIGVLVEDFTGGQTEHVHSADDDLILACLAAEYILSELDLKELSSLVAHVAEFVLSVCSVRRSSAEKLLEVSRRWDSYPLYALHLRALPLMQSEAILVKCVTTAWLQ